MERFGQEFWAKGHPRRNRKAVREFRRWRVDSPERLERRRLLAVAPTDAAETGPLEWQGRIVEARVDRWVGLLTTGGPSDAGSSARLAGVSAGLADSHPAWRATSLGGGCFTLFAPTATRDEVLAWAAATPAVTAIEPDFAFRVSAVPDDPSFSLQWALRNVGQNGGAVGADIRATQAWDVTTGSRSVVVGIVDSGIDVTHPDLAANIWTNPGEIPGNGVDDDCNGYVDDVHGWNFVDNTNVVDDGYGHGTHVAGIVGAVGDNGVGIAGVSWHVSLMALKFQDSRGIGSTSSMLAALNYATMMRRDHGIDVVATNNSWQSLGGFSSLVQDAIRAEGDAGIIVVAAAGNNGSDIDVTASYPACYRLPNVITVAASDGSGSLAEMSNYGATSVDLAAPGIMIQSTFPGGTYGILSGTSMAAPQVAGVVALLAAAKPGITVAEARAAILGSTIPASSMAGKTVTGGRLDARGALDVLLGTAVVPTPTPAPTPTPTPAPTPSPPPAPLVTLVNDTGAAADDRVTNDGRLAITGLEPGAWVEYSINAGRTWSGTFTARQGANSVSVRQTTLDGVRSPTTALQFKLDTVAPPPPRVALFRDTGASGADRITSIGTLRVAAERAARVEYSVDEGETWSDSFTAVEGPNAVRVRQTDLAGNTSRPTATAFAFALLSGNPVRLGLPAVLFTPRGTGGELDVTVTFDRRVRVAARAAAGPTIDVTVGSQTLRATYAGGSGSTQLRFRVRLTADGATAAAAGTLTVGDIRLPGGSSINDLAGNALLVASTG